MHIYTPINTTVAILLFFQKNKETFTVHVGKYSLSMDLELCTHIELKIILRNDTFYGRATEIT